MNWLLAKLLGVDPTKFEGIPLSKLSIRFLGMPQSWWALLTIAVLVCLVWLSFHIYQREGKTAGPLLKNFLACLRLGAIALVLLALFQPTLVIDQSRPLRSTVIVLVDNSLSMSIRDKAADTHEVDKLARYLATDASRLKQASRMEIARQLLGRNRAELLNELAQIYELKLMTFSDVVQEIPLRPPVPKSEAGTATAPALEQIRGPLVFNPSELRETGQSTNIELALRSALAQARGQPVAGLILLTDGQANAGDTLAAARVTGQKGVPVYTVGVGDPSPPRNIEVTNVTAPNVAYKEDDVIVRASVVAQGFAGKPVRVSLMESAKTGEAGREVAHDNVTLLEDGKPLEISLKFKPDTLGMLTYRVEVPLQPGEVIEADNGASTLVRVVDQKAQVLFVSGSPGKEYRYLKNFLIRDTALQAQCWLQIADPEFNQETSPGVKPLTQLPVTEEELFKYDVIILLDPNPGRLTAEWAGLVRRFVAEHGGGLVYIAGRVYTEELFANRQFAPLAEVIPVEVGRLSLTVQELLERAHEVGWPIVLTPQGLDSPLFKLENNPELNSRLWEQMPGIYWSQPVLATKPGGISLAVHSDPRRRIKEGPQPLVVMQFYGVGRALFVGFDSTWRWRYIEQGKYFNQFWGQTIRFLSQGRLLGGRKRVLVFTDKDTYTVGQPVEITVRMLEQDYEHPMLKAEVTAVVKAEDGSTTEVKLTPDISREGDYKGSLLAVKPGLLEITPKVFDPTLVEKMADKIVRVTLPQLEFKETRMNEPLLRQIADVTRGRYLQPHQFSELRRLLPEKQVMLVNETTEDLWDAPILLVLFCLLLFTEWSIRKWKNMA